MSTELRENELLTKFNQLKFREGSPKAKRDPRMRRGAISWKDTKKMTD